MAKALMEEDDNGNDRDDDRDGDNKCVAKSPNLITHHFC